MLLEEALVIFACVNSTGCSETSSQYYATHPEFRSFVEYEEKRIRNYVGPQVLDTVGPVLFVVAGGTGTIRLNQYFGLQFSRSNGTLTFKKEF